MEVAVALINIKGLSVNDTWVRPQYHQNRKKPLAETNADAFDALGRHVVEICRASITCMG